MVRTHSFLRCHESALTKVNWRTNPSQDTAFSSRGLFVQFWCLILINTSHIELLILLELLRTVVRHITWCPEFACEPAPVISIRSVTQRGSTVGSVPPRCPLRAVPPQLHCCACQPPLQIGTVWIAVPPCGNGRGLIKKRTSFWGIIPDCISFMTLQIASNDSLLILHFGAYFVEK